MGIAAYNEACRSIVMRYSGEWANTVRRVGRWIDFENDYKTLDPEYMARGFIRRCCSVSLAFRQFR
jgi:isoleucyl-tRNA synthetase